MSFIQCDSDLTLTLQASGIQVSTPGHLRLPLPAPIPSRGPQAGLIPGDLLERSPRNSSPAPTSQGLAPALQPYRDTTFQTHILTHSHTHSHIHILFKHITCQSSHSCPYHNHTLSTHTHTHKHIHSQPDSASFSNSVTCNLPLTLTPKFTLTHAHNHVPVHTYSLKTLTHTFTFTQPLSGMNCIPQNLCSPRTSECELI